MTRATRSSLLAFALLVIVSLALAPATASGQDRAQDVLAQARAAAGAKTAPQGVTSLAVGANVRRVVPSVGMELTSNVQLEFLFPDKYRRTEEMTIGPVTRTISTGLNGADLLYDDGGAAAMMGMDPKAPGPMHDQAVKGLKEDAFRMITLMLLAPPSHLSCTVTSAGVAEAPDGKADVVDVKGPDKLNLRLFFDTSTHVLLLASYDTETPDPEKVNALTQEMMAKAKADPGNMKQTMQDMRDAMDKLPKKATTVQMHFSEPKSLGGIKLPTKMTVDTPQGQEEWTFTSLKLNPPLKADRFAK